MNLNNPDYPYNQYYANGKPDMKKILAQENIIPDHVLCRLLLCVVAEQQKEIEELKNSLADKLFETMNERLGEMVKTYIGDDKPPTGKEITIKQQTAGEPKKTGEEKSEWLKQN